MNNALITPEEADRAIYRALTLFIGRGRRYSVEDIAIGTGIPGSTIAKWLTPDPLQRRRPKGSHLLVIRQYIGVEFTNKELEAIGQGGRALHAEEGSPGLVMAHLTRDLAQIAGCGVSGSWNHTHERDLEEAADDAITILTPLSSRGYKQ